MRYAFTASVFLGLGGAAVVLASFACSGPANLWQTDGGSTKGGHEEDGGLACNDFAAAKCAKLDSCTENMYTLIHYGSPSECQAREALACLGILAAPDTTATPNGFEQCGKELPSAACIDFFDLTNQTPACTPQVGPRANGRSCVNNGQCQSTWCYAKTGAACGVCASRPAAGADCTANVDCGGNGMLCSQAYTCGLAVTAGGACDSGDPCGYGLSCVAGKCEASATTVGATCDNQLADAPLCAHDDGLYCPSATSTCTAATLRDAGATCGVSPGTVIAGTDASTPSKSLICTAGAACEPSTAPVGECAAPAKEAATCDTLTGPPCLTPARCVSGSDGSPMGTCAILEQTKDCD